MRIAKTLAYAAVAVCTTVCAEAQNTETDQIQRDVDVVNIYQPTLHRARKMFVAPSQDDTMTYRPNFNYETLNRVSTVTTTPDSLSAAEMSFPASYSQNSGLAQGAVGSSPSVFGQVFYNTGEANRYGLALNAGHLAMLGKIKLEDDSKVKAPQNDTWARLDYSKFGKNVRFGAGFRFKNEAYRFYGLNSLEDSVAYVAESGSDVFGKAVDDVLKQRNTTVDAHISFSSTKPNPRQAFSFDADASYGFFANKYGMKESDIHFGGNMRFPIKEHTAMEAAVNVNHFMLHPGDNDSIMSSRERHGTDIGVAPHFLLDFDIMNLAIGLRFIAIVGDKTNKDDFLVQPDIKANFYVGDGSVRIYAGVTGDYKANSYRQIVETNRYVSPDSRMYIWLPKKNAFAERNAIRSAQSPIVFQFGVRSKFSQKVQMHVGMDYASIADEVFFVNRQFAVKGDTTFAHSSHFAVLQDDGKRFRAHAEFSVSPTASSNILLKGTYNKYDMDAIGDGWYKPQYEVDLCGRFMPIERLQIRAAFGLKGGMKAYDPTKREVTTLSNFIDLNLGGQYYISSNWSAFLDVNNITAADQMRWLGYSTYRVNAMAGITYRF